MTMANTEQVEILKQGVEAWNAWRKQQNPDTHKAGVGAAAWEKWRENNPELIPDLSEADLSGMDLRKANFRGANLSNADLRNADLRGTDMYYSDLGGVSVRGAKFSNMSSWPYGFNPVIRGAVYEPD
jgi:hypothetical protein